MTLFILLVVTLGILEIFRMNKEGLKKEIIIYSVISFLSLAFAIYYFTSEEPASLSSLLMDLLKIDY